MKSGRYDCGHARRLNPKILEISNLMILDLNAFLPVQSTMRSDSNIGYDMILLVLCMV